MLSFFSGAGASAAISKPEPSNDDTDALTLQPSARFLAAEADDLKLGEVSDLLSEYKRVALALQALQQREQQTRVVSPSHDAVVPDTTVAVQTE